MRLVLQMIYDRFRKKGNLCFNLDIFFRMSECWIIVKIIFMRYSILSCLSWFLILSYFCTFSQADVLIEKCPSIETCASIVSELLGQKYIFDPELVKGKVQATGNMELTKENAELLFTQMLHISGFSRVPIGQANTFQILREREARDSTIPIVKADKLTPPLLPNLWDVMILQYKLTFPKSADQIISIVRGSLPANARIVNAELNGSLLITDSALNLKRIYELVRDLDQKPILQGKKLLEEAEKIRKAKLDLFLENKAPTSIPE